MARKPTRMEALEAEARRVGLFVDSYSPGDGVTRYRFITRSDRDYFSASGSERVYTALGLKEAYTFLAGYGSGHSRRRRATPARRRAR